MGIVVLRVVVVVVVGHRHTSSRVFLSRQCRHWSDESKESFFLPSCLKEFYVHTFHVEPFWIRQTSHRMMTTSREKIVIANVAHNLMMSTFNIVAKSGTFSISVHTAPNRSVGRSVASFIIVSSLIKTPSTT